MNEKTIKTLAAGHLYSFLSENRAKGQQNTHNSSASPKGSFCIDTEEKNEIFLKLYKKSIDVGNDMYLTERSPEIGCPIKIDIDLTFKINDETELKVNEGEIIIEEHYYTINTVKTFLFRYVEQLKKIIDLKSIEKFYAILLEKPTPTKKHGNIISDGFHIIFPYIVTNYKIQHYIRERLLDRSIFDSIFGDIPYTNDEWDVFDKAVIDRNWTMYGSHGKIGGAVYLIGNMFILNPNPTSEKDIIAKNLTLDDLNSHEKENIPKFLSVRNKGSCLPFLNKLIDREIEEWYYYRYEKPREKKNIKENINDYDIKFVRKLIEILNPKRADNYNDWSHLCWCLHNIDEKYLLEDFIEFSKKSKKFKEGECEKLWNRAKKGLRIGTLYYWAKQDNEREYKALMVDNIDKKIESLPNTHIGIARIIYELYKYEFICINPTSNKDRMWFYFDDHIWKPNSEPILYKKITDDASKYFRNFHNKFSRLSEVENNAIERDTNDYKNSKSFKICSNLESVPFVDNIIRACGFLFHRSDFYDIIDSNPDLIAFTNGIYDLKNFTFRNGLPDDFITMTTGVKYIEYNSPANEYKDNIEQFMKDILPNAAVREYAWNVMATIVHGDNEEQKFYVLTGSGGNGKSILLNILNECFGNYGYPLDIALITQKRKKSSNASPDIMVLKNRRLAVLNEPDKDDTLNMGIVKALTGGDKITARNLFENQTAFRNKAKLIMSCNDLPKPSSQDNGVWRRIRVIHFPMNFVENPIEENEKLRDNTLETQAKEWKESFMSMLIERFRILKQTHGGIIPEPKEVTEYTDNYREQTNVMLQFSREIIQEAKGESINYVLLYQTFRNWFVANCPGNKILPRKDLLEFIKKKYKKSAGKISLKGYKIGEEEDSDIEDNEKKGIDNVIVIDELN